MNGSGLLLPRAEGVPAGLSFFVRRELSVPVCIWWAGACPELVKAPYVSGPQSSLVSPSISLQGCLSAMQWNGLLGGEMERTSVNQKGRLQVRAVSRS